ncbi:MAG: hypothetical protein IJ266_04355, partial [Elusimicrobiaceae bacterium]|nr:hypothetical protein [Elusimicrobiaceae bacterium]
MFKKWVMVGCLLGCGGAVLASGLPERILDAQVEQAQGAFPKHFGYMRFYKPSLQIPQPLNLWDQWFSSKIKQQHQRALAVYLFNMYVVARNYSLHNLRTLDFNMLGVLDGFMRCHKPFDFKNASRFYGQNQQEVNALLRQFLQARSLPWPEPSNPEYVQWVQLLESVPQRYGVAAYTWPQVNLWGVGALLGAQTKWENFLKQALQIGKNQVVLYDEPAATLEDFDSPLVPKQARRKRTYRWVADECNYMSYLVARQLTQAAQQRALGYAIRIYTVTAYPAQGEFLTPSTGDRFKLANGKNGLLWRYHTAVLVISK